MMWTNAIVTGASSGIGAAIARSFVTSFSQALCAELEPEGVHVTCIAPGFTRTEFQERADYDSSKMPEFMRQTADEVATIALDATAENKAFADGVTRRTRAVPGSWRRVRSDRSRSR